MEMKVNNVFDPRWVAETYAQRNEKSAPKKINGPERQEMSFDQVELTARGQELQLYRRRLKDIPEIRGELVEKVKRQLDEGSYKIDAEEIAAGIVKECCLDKRLDKKV